MFDIGFWELCLIAVIALLVFGPEKLPGAARSTGLWIGRIRRMISSVKQDIDRELHLQEIQESVKKSDQNVHQFLEDTKSRLDELKKPISLDPIEPTGDKSDSSPSNTLTSSTETSSKT
ncbi:twin-arginine translocation protein TatB [Beggiatoa sp. PS]|nr:twin-arginine translocation protein TatB [Beggiatoa sp. PS]